MLSKIARCGRVCPASLRLKTRRSFSNYKWFSFQEDSAVNFVNLESYNQIQTAESIDTLSSIPFNPRAIFNDLYDLTTEMVYFISEPCQMGWVAGIILGSALLR